MSRYGVSSSASVGPCRIGGVLAPEPAGRPRGALPHPQALALSTGRACLALIAETLHPARLYLPFYTCNTVFQPFVERGVPLAFYAIGADLRPQDPPELRRDEYLLWTDYFGICGAITAELVGRYGERLIIDDTHAFFAGRHDGHWSFSSARKFFGVPDGAFLYAPRDIRSVAPRFASATQTHLELSAAGKTAAAYRAELAYEMTLDAKIRAISVPSEEMLRRCDFAAHARIRRDNFLSLHAALGATNRVSVDTAAAVAPFCYPYLSKTPIPDGRAQLHRRGIFVPRLWLDAASRAVSGFAWERTLSTELLALPVDPRYGAADMDRLAGAVLALADH